MNEVFDGCLSEINEGPDEFGNNSRISGISPLRDLRLRSRFGPFDGERGVLNGVNEV